MRENLIFSRDDVFYRMVKGLLDDAALRKPIAVWDADTVSEDEFRAHCERGKVTDNARVAAVSFDDAVLARISENHSGITTLARPFPLDVFASVFDDADADESADVSANIGGNERGNAIAADRETAVVTVNSKAVKLTAKEFELFEMLYSHKGEIVGRDEISAIFGEDGAGNTADVYIHYLRKKLGKTSIVSVRGKGYRLSL